MSQQFSPVNGQTFKEAVKQAMELGIKPILAPRNASIKTGYKIGDHWFQIPEDLQATEKELDRKAVLALTLQNKAGSETSWFMNADGVDEDLLAAM